MKYSSFELVDRHRLQEIYRLRVSAWQAEQAQTDVNSSLFPEGWSDSLDEDAHHMCVENPEKEIIASARLNCFESYREFPFYRDVTHIDFPKGSPVGFYARLVVSPSYQGQGLSLILDDAILSLSRASELKWIVGLSGSRTQFMVERLGFKVIGEAATRYHPNSAPRKVNIIIREFSHDF